MILHLPIGFLLLAFLLEIFSRFRRLAHLRASVSFVLVLGVLSAIVSAVCGFLLSLDGGYDEDTLFWHQWLGVGTTVLAFFATFFKRKRVKTGRARYGQMYWVVFLMALGTLAVGAHFGGSLTHGSDYLTRYMPGEMRTVLGLPERAEKAEPKAIVKVDDAVVFTDFIQPVFEAKCLSCHNLEKQRGGLLLATQAGILAGGDNGEVIVPSKADESELFVRITLPEDDDERMPPEGKKQLTAEETRLIEWWISSGASFNATVASSNPPDDVQSFLVQKATPPPPKKSIFDLEVSPVSENDLASLKALGVSISPIAQNTGFLQASFTAVQDSAYDNALQNLAPISQQLTWLDLGNTEIANAHLQNIGGLKNLTRLHLENTDITDAGLAYLKPLEKLEYLNLYGTAVTDSGLAQLSELSTLQKLYLWETDVTEEGAEALQGEIADLEVNLGFKASDSLLLGGSKLSRPQINFENTILSEPEEVSITGGFQDVEIRYTLDGAAPTDSSLIYAEPLLIEKSTVLTAIALKEGWETSEPVRAEFIFAPRQIADAVLQIQASEKYPGDGPKSLIDKAKGTQNFRDGKWLGFERDDCIATLDLGEVDSVQSVFVGCLEDMDAWIFYPTAIEVEASVDGEAFSAIAKQEITYPTEGSEASHKNFVLTFDKTEARFIRVKVTNIGLCPEWHHGAGGKAWIFLDEIVVE